MSEAEKIRKIQKAIPYDYSLTDGVFPPGDVIDDHWPPGMCGKLQFGIGLIPFEHSPLNATPLWDEIEGQGGRARGVSAEEPLIRIRMLETKDGSPDGISVLEYQAGSIFDVPKSLADVFLREGWAEIAQ